MTIDTRDTMNQYTDVTHWYQITRKPTESYFQVMAECWSPSYHGASKTIRGALMRRIVLTFGLIAAGILSAMMVITMVVWHGADFDNGAVIGYTTMVVAFLMIY